MKRFITALATLAIVLGVFPAVSPNEHAAFAMPLGEGYAVSGDFRGVGRTQIATLHDPDDDLGLRISLVEEDGADRFAAQPWLVAGPNSFDLSRMKVAATDVDFDGKSDLVALYDDGGTSVRLLVFRSTGTSFVYVGAWWQSDGYAWSRVSAVLSGNFSAVGNNGLLFVYQYDDYQMRIHYLESDGTRFLYNGNAGVYDSGPGQYDTVRARFAIGRFTRDSGPDQIASIYQYPNFRIRIHVFDPSPQGLQPVNGWDGLYDSGENAFDLGRMKIARSDVEGDGRADIVSLYRYDDGSTRLHLFSGIDNMKLTSGVGIGGTASGALDWATAQVLGGDWDGDGRGDLGLIDLAADGATNARLMRATGTRELTSVSVAMIAPAVPLACTACWPLSGNPLRGASAGRRPLSVRIDNAPAARPHYGLSEADQVWEFLVEGNVTRLNAILHEGNPGTVGSIRSARLSDRYLSPMLRAALVYSGATIEEKALIVQDAGAGRYIDLSHDRFGEATFYRTPTRVSPYNLFSSSDLLRQAVNAAGGGGAVTVPSFGFLRSANHIATSGGFDGSGFATTLTIPYRERATVRYDYDAAGKTYARYQHNGAGAMVREVDASNGVAIAAKNVVTIFTDVFVANPPIVQDALGSLGLDMRMTGGGAASIFRDGRRQDGTWSRPTLDDVFTFKSGGGEMILLSPGQTWFHVVPADWTIPSS